MIAGLCCGPMTSLTVLSSFGMNAQVYDVTSFLHDHPGGDDVMLAVAGTDATEAFEEVRHNIRAKMMLNGFKVGNFLVRLRCSLPSPFAAGSQRSSSSELAWQTRLVIRSRS